MGEERDGDGDRPRPDIDGLWSPRGEMAALIAGTDWASTPIGPVAEWPESLRLLVDICLATPTPLMIAWGPEAVQIYNDALAPLMGDKHPHALGRPYSQSFPEIWDGLQSPQVAAVLERGASTHHEDQQLCFVRDGALEEMYWTFGWSPIRTDDGEVLGAFHPATEVTSRVLSSRRLTTLAALAARGVEERTVRDACDAAMDTVAGAPDLPFCLVYLTSPDGREAHLAGCAGVEPGGVASPTTVSLVEDLDDEGWPLASAGSAGTTVRVDDLGARFGPLPGDPWPEPAGRALVVPFVGQREPGGFLVAGLNPRRPLDPAYQAFVELVARQISASAADAAAYERQHEISSTLQRSLLPASVPPVPGLDVVLRYQPGGANVEVGGDWYDVVRLDGGRHVGLVIGDVAGHDIPAAAAMGRLSSALRAYALEGHSPAGVLDRLHDHVGQLAGVDLATLLYGVLDTSTGSLRFANAGHPPPLVVVNGEARLLHGGLSAPIGAPSGDPRAEVEVVIGRSDTVVLYTDGLVESRLTDLENGFGRLLAAASVGPLALEALADHLVDAVPDPKHDDDIALLALRLR